MASSSPSTSSSPAITFFGTCPTVWKNLNSDQRDSCIAQAYLVRRVEDHYAWNATGELAKQWNENGYQEYSAVIEFSTFRTGKLGLGRDRIASHELRLLSTTPDRESATPFVIITSRNLKRAQETVGRLQKHPRLCKFGFSYMARQGGLRLTAGKPSSSSSSSSSAPSIGISEPVHSLCGARIAVYKHAETTRFGKKQVATIGGVFHIGRKYYALTTAHVFFDNVASTGSWADSGLYITTESSVSMVQNAPRPEIYGSYEILVESFWPHITGIDGEAQSDGTSLGLFEPQVTHRRRELDTKAFSEVVWNIEMDWALIELRDPALCGPNVLQISSEVKLRLQPPIPHLKPPSGKVIIVAGVSGPVHGTGLGTVGGVMLPWSSSEIQAWSIETEIGELLSIKLISKEH